MIYKEKSTNDKTKCISPGFRVFSAILCLLAIGLAIYAAINNPKSTIEVAHYELEFHVGVKGRSEYDYETVTQKYEKPILTTMLELKKDFPMGEANRSPVVVEEKNLELEDEELVWAYVSRYDDYICDDMVFVYDKLEVSNESADIETHFEITEHIPSTAANFDILVLTIIPANQ